MGSRRAGQGRVRLRLRRGIGADLTASGATRIAGSENIKPASTAVGRIFCGRCCPAPPFPSEQVEEQLLRVSGKARERKISSYASDTVLSALDALARLGELQR
jgi:hypothetical protein